jgi:hypothetical protein
MSYNILYHSENQQWSTLNLAGVSLECKNFCKLLDENPSDRHAYKLKMFSNPLAIGRLPITTKNFYKFVRLVSFLLLVSSFFLLIKFTKD